MENKFEIKLALHQMMQYLPSPKQVIIQVLEKKQKEISEVIKNLADTIVEGDTSPDAKKPDSVIIAQELNKAYLARLKAALKIVNELKTDE
jgi:hypothetical protein